MNSALFARQALSKGRDSARAPSRNDEAAPREEAERPNRQPEASADLTIGDQSISLHVMLDLPAAAGVSATQLCTLVVVKLCDVIRRLGRVQAE